MRRVLFVFVFGLALLAYPLITLAQTDDTPVEPDNPDNSQPVEFVPRYHTVAEGESLYFIATFYGVTQEAMEIANSITDPTLLFVGQQLLIPAADGEIVPATYAPRFGENLDIIAERFGATPNEIIRENYLLSPNSVIGGQPLRVFSRTGSSTPGEAPGVGHIVRPGETLATISAQYGLTLAAVMDANDLTDDLRLHTGQRLRIPTLSNDAYTTAPGLWQEMSFNNFPIRQGDTVAVYIEYLEPGTPFGRITSPTGELIPIRFKPEGDGYTGLIGFDAFSAPGQWDVVIGGEGDARPWDTFETSFFVAGAGFSTQYIPLEDDQELRNTENTFLNTIFIDSNPEPLWTDVFRIPITGTVSAGYGDARSYNNGPIYAFHSGIDFRGNIGTPIFAPAEGVVVFAGELGLRGNALIVDHGMGVMTGYYHLDGFDVALGETVEPLQQIARGGDTGLSTGPHLHWDLRVWGKAVHPTRWLERLFP